MSKNGDSEFELVLGNRQLLSVFFIVVVLVAVFFTMGYIVGKNSGPGSAEAKTAQKQPAVADSPRPSPTAGPAVEEPKPETPVQPSAPPAGNPPAKAVEPEKKTEPSGAAPAPEDPIAGQTYVQVAAVQRAEAEIFLDVLGKKGFHAIYTQVPDKPEMYRVLVGPYKDAAAVGQARNDLDQAGFKNTIVRKY